MLTQPGTFGSEASGKYGELRQLQSVSDAGSAGVSPQTASPYAQETGKRFIIAVAENHRSSPSFSTYCPQPEQKNFGLGLLLSSPTIIWNRAETEVTIFSQKVSSSPQ